jgi:membrane complex biogenesis BtpA family protein
MQTRTPVPVPHLVGMLHLPALPGSPAAEHSLEQIETAVLDEARLLSEAGFDACMIENFGDAPFFAEDVPPITVASMARLAAAVRREFADLQLGINVLRNDARAALSVAVACEASFIRVNVHVGSTATDQGVLQGRAATTLRLRRALQARVAIWADVQVKHGRSLTHDDIRQEATDCVQRGGADALIVSGEGTGRQADLEQVRQLRELDLGVPLYVGSGVNEDNVARTLSVADGVIVGTALKVGGRTRAPVDVDRVRRFVDKVRQIERA